MNLRRRVFLTLTLLWMIIIFCFSARDAVTSTEDSMRVGRVVAETVIPGFREWPQPRQVSFIHRIDHAVRKSAHCLEYAVLGILLTGFFAMPPGTRTSPGSWIRRAWLTGTLYAVTDEIHQIFVAGRSCQITDVMIDSGGVLLGILLALLFLWLMPVWRTVLYRIGFGG